MKVLEYLLENRGKVFNQAFLARSLGLSPSTVSRVSSNLAKEGIVLEEKLEEKMKILCLNEGEEKTRLILELYERMKKVSGSDS